MRVFAAIIAFLAVLFGVAYCSEAVACHAHWSNSGHKSSYGLFSECLVQKKDGTWVPEDSYRNFTGDNQ